MLIRAILPVWARDSFPDLPGVVEGDFPTTHIEELNDKFYCVYYLPNYPKTYDTSSTVDGTHIDTFEYVFCDMDLKDGEWTKESFVDRLVDGSFPLPSRIVDSGGGIHAYWRVVDLDAKSYLKLQRRLCRYFKTDEAVAKIFQLMRLPNYVNTKREDDFRLCQEIHSEDLFYTCEALDTRLPPLSQKDADYCEMHFNKTYKLYEPTAVSDKIPLKFAHLLKNNKEANQIWVLGLGRGSK